tara:strand:+ start:47 stop:676 length:630 start_codon:yes stop_codon:yes gene_type:complete
MKLIRINYDGTMNDITINTKINKKNILKHLNKNSISKGDGELKELYRWKVNGDSEITCYGWCDGHAGFENKHDLPPSGMSDFIDDEDSSDKKILFGDIFILLSSSGTFKDIDVSNYANYYELLFEGFDDCNTSDDELSDDDEYNEDDKNFINDADLEEPSDDDSDYTNSIEELDIDENDYTDDDSEYNEECEGEETEGEETEGEETEGE